MESDLALALMEKARRVYESEKTFLSFPLSAISFAPAELNFFQGSDDDPTGKLAINSRAQFSRLVNQIPRGITYPPDEESYLWDVYEDILTRSEVALTVRTEDEERSLQGVIDLLYVETDDGVRSPSAKYAKYIEFGDADITMREQFNVEKIEVEFSDSAAERERWTDQRLPEWRAKFKALAVEWTSEGFRLEIEQALRREASLLSRSPLRTWDEWASTFDKDLDLQNTIGQLPFVRTEYLPVNATREGSWTEFSMSKAVAIQLIAQAPEELRKKLVGHATAVEELKTLTFEYSTAKIDRFWFAPHVFESRFFKYSKTISEGDDGEGGVCPAYVAGVVFARNIQVAKAAPKRPERPLVQSDRAIASTMSFGFVNQEGAREFREKQSQLKSLPMVLAINEAALKPRKRSAQSAQRTTAHKLAARQLDGAVMPVMPMRPTIKARKATLIARKLKAVRVRGQLVNSPPKTPPPSSPEEADDSIYILAFICKKVPRSPDPDLSLDWDF